MSAASDLFNWAKSKKRNWDVISAGPRVVQKASDSVRLGNEEYTAAREFTKRGDAKGLKDLIKSAKSNLFNH